MSRLDQQSENETATLASHMGVPVILLIVAIAVALRLWGVSFGLPYVYHTDEGREVIRALQLGSGSFDFGRVLKGGYFYLLFFEYGVYFAVLKLMGVVHSAIDFAHLYIQEPSNFYLIGRVTTALIGAFNVFLLYVMGKRIYSPRVGILSALFLALNILHARNSHYVTVDVPMTCLTTLSLWYAIRVSQTKRPKYYILSGLFAGLAIQTKAPSVVVLIPLLIAHWFALRRDSDRTRLTDFLLGKGIILAVITVVVVTVAGSPGFILHAKSVFGFFMRFFRGAETSLASAGMVNVREPVNLWAFYLNALRLSMGIPLLIASLLGVLYGIYKHKREDTLLIVFLVSYYILISASRHPYLFYDRYVLPLLPILALLGARFIEEVFLTFAPDRARVLSTALAFMVVVSPGYLIFREDYLISHKDTRTFAKEWIESNIPAGSKILIEGSRTKPYPSTVPLRNSRENIERNMEAYRETEPGKAKYFEYELKLLSGNTYDLLTVGDHISMSADKWKDVSRYREAGVEYMILRPKMFEGKSPQLARFHQSVKQDPQVSLIKTFESNRTNRPGPTIEIYHIENGMN